MTLIKVQQKHTWHIRQQKQNVYTINRNSVEYTVFFDVHRFGGARSAWCRAATSHYQPRTIKPLTGSDTHPQSKRRGRLGEHKWERILREHANKKERYKDRATAYVPGTVRENRVQRTESGRYLKEAPRAFPEM